jgi:hypothetical protein
MESVKEYLLNNEKELLNVINEINSLNGDLDNLNFMPLNEETINEQFDTPWEAMNAVKYGEVNFNDDVFRFEADGNITSFSEYEMIEECKDYIDDVISCLEDCYYKLDISDNLTELIEESEKEETSLDDLIKGAVEKTKDQPVVESKNLDMER